MTLKFNDIMRKYYEDEKLGIKNEDAPANSVAGGGVDLSIDKKIDKEKKKRKIYMMEEQKKQDSSSKESKHFVQKEIVLLEKK